MTGVVAIAKSKVGRKAKHFRAADGREIHGLGYHAKSKRWRIIATNRFFRAPNEKAAIEKFHELTGAKPTRAWLKRFGLQDNISTPMGQVYHRLAIADYNNEDPWLELWKIVGEHIHATPQLIAELTGVEKIGYLDTLAPPEKLPTITELETIWKGIGESSNLTSSAFRFA